MGLWTGARCHKFLCWQITFELASRSSNNYCCLLFNFSSASFIRQLSWWYKSVVKEDCSFSNFGTEAFPVSCYLGNRFCTRCITGEIHSTVMTKSNDPATFSALIIEKFQIVHRTLNRRLFSRCMLKFGMYDDKKNPKTNTRKEPFRDPQFAAFVPSLHAQSQSGNSLTFISWYPDPSGCNIVKMDEKEKRKTVEGRASEFDFIQFYFFTVTYETHGNMTLFAGN